MVGVGLAYAYGYFDQSLDANGWQQEHYFSSSEAVLPLELVRNEYGQPVRIAVQTESYEIWVGIWQVRVGRNLLLLLDTNVDGNSDEDRALTSRLYGGDRRTRIRQELILGVGGMRALQELGVRPSVIHLNEGHSAFAILELARMLMERDGQTFDNVRELATGMTVFTTHTAVPAGHDVFEPALVEQTLAPLRRQLGLSQQQLLALGRLDPEQRRRVFLDDRSSDSRCRAIATRSPPCTPASRRRSGSTSGPALRSIRSPSTTSPTASTWIPGWPSPWRICSTSTSAPTGGKGWTTLASGPAVEEMDDLELWEKDQELRAASRGIRGPQHPAAGTGPDRPGDQRLCPSRPGSIRTP